MSNPNPPAAAPAPAGRALRLLLLAVGGALAALVLCYLAARELGVRPALAGAGAAALAGCPVFIFTSIQPLSATLATTWSLAAFLAALRARRHTAWAAARGAAFAVAHVPASLVACARWLAVLLPTVLLALPLAALWFGAAIGLFASFDSSHESWWSLRYLLPAVAALILGALLGLEALAHRLQWPRRPAVMPAIAAGLALWAEETAALRERCPGAWTRLGAVRNIAFWRLDAPAP